MINNNAANVSVGKPKVGGSIKVAPIGTPLPTDAVSALDSAFENLGFISDAGVTNSNSAETESIKEWGGTTVLVTQTSKEDTFQYALIEALNKVVLKHVYGDENVSGDLETGLTVIANNNQQEEHSIVIDMILQGGYLKRIVIPNGRVSSVDTITYASNSAIAYNTTLFCAPDDSQYEATHYEYIQKATTPPAPTTYTVTFNSNGGSAVSSQTVESGGKVTEPEDPTKEDYTFGGWYKEDTLTTEWDFTNDTVSGNTTLYAKWTS